MKKVHFSLVFTLKNDNFTIENGKFFRVFLETPLKYRHSRYGVYCVSSLYGEEFRGEGSRGEESRAGGIPCGRKPVWEEFRGRNPVGGVPCGRNPDGIIYNTMVCITGIFQKSFVICSQI